MTSTQQEMVNPLRLRCCDDVGLFQAIKARLVKISDKNEGGKNDKEIETAIKQIISEAITADKVIDIFDAAGIKKPSIEILDERFLQKLKDLPQKNLAVELLKKLLKDEIKRYHTSKNVSGGFGDWGRKISGQQSKPKLPHPEPTTFHPQKESALKAAL